MTQPPMKEEQRESIASSIRRMALSGEKFLAIAKFVHDVRQIRFEEPSRILLFRHLRDAFNLPLHKLTELGTWRGFGVESNSMSDGEVNDLFAQLISEWRQGKESHDSA